MKKKQGGKCHIDRGSISDRSDRNDKGGGISMSRLWAGTLDSGPEGNLKHWKALARTINQGVEKFFSASLFLRFGCFCGVRACTLSIRQVTNGLGSRLAPRLTGR